MKWFWNLFSFQGRALLFLFLCLCSFEEVLGRKFDFKSEHISTSLSLGLTYPGLDKKPYEFSSGVDSVFSKGHKVVFVTDLSLIVTASEFLNFNASLGLIFSSVETKGYREDSTATRFDLKSDLFVLNPHLSLEVKLFRSQFQRFYIFFGGGWGRLYLTNNYRFTPIGVSELGLEEDRSRYKERLYSNLFSGHLGLGWESLLVDVVTVFLGAGYVYRPVPSLRHNNSIDTLFQGRAKRGDKAKTQTGDLRHFSLSSFFIKIGFRFYIN